MSPDIFYVVSTYCFKFFQITPFLFILMTRKTEVCYSHLFTYIDANICSLSGATFISDYEKGMRNALRSLHPSMRYTACWFHFTQVSDFFFDFIFFFFSIYLHYFFQACKKNAKKLTGFEASVKSSKPTYILFMKFLHLPLLPATKIVEAFTMLRHEAIALNKKLFSPFLSYYEKQWIINV